MGARDDQYLFELHVRLQYAENDAGCIAALFELSGAAVHSLPPEAFFQRQGLLNTVLDTLRRDDLSEQALLLGLSFLRTIAWRTGQALADAVNCEMVPHYAGDSRLDSTRMVRVDVQRAHACMRMCVAACSHSDARIETSSASLHQLLPGAICI